MPRENLLMSDKSISTRHLFYAVAIATTLTACAPSQSNRDDQNSPTTQQASVPRIEDQSSVDSTPKPVKPEPVIPKPVIPEPEPLPEPKPEITPVIPEPPVVNIEPEPIPEKIPAIAAEVTPTVKPEPIPAPKPVIPLDPSPITISPPTSNANTTLRGRLTLTSDNNRYLEGNAINNAVIYFTPATGTHPVSPGSFEIGTRNKRLEPDVLAVPLGSEVNFPNYDAILHNVFSVSPISMFDLGFINANESSSHTFNKPGQATVHCNVHHSMRADILVLTTPYYAQPDIFGNFEIANIPTGGGELTVWHPQADEDVQTLNIPAAGTLDLELELVRSRIPQHLNKYGESYRPKRAGS